jgi:hypothetical protein
LRGEQEGKRGEWGEWVDGSAESDVPLFLFLREIESFLVFVGQVGRPS